MSLQRSGYERLWLPSCSHSLSGSSHLLTLMEIRCCVVSCTMERPMWQGTEDRGPPANGQQGTKALSPTAHKELIANNHMSGLGIKSFPSWALSLADILFAASWKILSQRTQLSCAWISDLWNCEINVVVLSPLYVITTLTPNTYIETSTSQPESISLHVSILSQLSPSSLGNDKVWGISHWTWGLGGD